MQPKRQYDTIFVNIEGRRFVAMFEQTELRSTPMGPSGLTNAKGTAKFAPDVAVLGNPAFLVLVILVILDKTKPFWYFWPAIFELGRRGFALCGYSFRANCAKKMVIFLSFRNGAEQNGGLPP